MTPLYSSQHDHQPTYRQLYETAQRMAALYIVKKGSANTIEAELVHMLISLKQKSNDFPLKAFCDENDLRYSTMSGYVSDMGYFDIARRLETDPDFKMPVTGWRVLRHLIRRGLPDDLAYDLAADYLEAQETGVYNELGLIDATIANMKDKGEQLLRDLGLEVEDVQRKKYPVSDPQTGAKTRYILEELGMVDVAAIDETGWYRLAVTVIEEVEGGD